MTKIKIISILFFCVLIPTGSIWIGPAPRVHSDFELQQPQKQDELQISTPTTPWRGRLLDGESLCRVFEDVFGASTNSNFKSRSTPVCANLIWNQYEDMGGNCEPNNPYGGGGYWYVAPQDHNTFGNGKKAPRDSSVQTCGSDALRSTISPFGNPLITRMASIARSCQQILLRNGSATVTGASVTMNSEENLKVAIARARAPAGTDTNSPIDINSLENGGYPGQSDFTKVYQQFYPGETPSAAILTALQNVVNTSNSLASTNTGQPNASQKPLDAWRAVFMAVCLSAGWQIP